MEDRLHNAKTQVVIIGAGPTGLTMAAQLIRYNIDFILLEKNAGITKLSKAVVVQARSMEIFDELGLADEALTRGRQARAMTIFNKGKQKFSVPVARFGEGSTAFPYVLSLEQSKTEALLAEYVSGKGKTIHWECEFLRYEEQAQGLTVHYKDAGGAAKTISALYLVGCEGAHSLVRHQMGAAFEGDTVAKLFYVADVTLSSPVINKDALFGFLIKKGFVLFFPMEGAGHYRVIGILPDRADDTITFEEIEPGIKAAIVVPVEFEQVRWFSMYKVHSRMATAFMKGRCFIAGDSAHIHTPAGGQGMNTGIQDSYNLAWKLAGVIDGTLSPSILETYATERMQNARHLLRTTDRMFDIMAGINRLWDFVRLHVVPVIANLVIGNTILNKNIFPLVSQTGIAYPDSKLTVKSAVGKVKAGDRMPYFVLADGSSSYDKIKSPVFKLLFFGNAAPAFDILAGQKVRVETILFRETPKAVFGDANNFYVLLRPDNHILYLGKDIQKCKAAFGLL